MELKLFNKEVNTIWKKAAGRSPNDQVRFEAELYKHLLKFFQVGDYFFLIFNIPDFKFEFVSNEIEPLLGYSPPDFDLDKLMDIIHADDRPYFLDFEKRAGEFLASIAISKLMNFKIRYDYRVRKANGDYIRILQQSMVIEHDENGGIVRTLATHTNISDIKSAGTPVLSIIGFDGEPSFINVDIRKALAISKNVLTDREKQILVLIIDGKLSKEIGVILMISKLTVDKHRKNMLTKTGLSNTGELIAHAIKKGWI